MKKPTVLFLLFLLSCLPLLAQQNSSVSAAVDKTAILIGERFQLTLTATFSNPHTITFSTPDTLPHFEILDRTKPDTQQVNNQTIVTQTLTLTSWDSGAWALQAPAPAGAKNTLAKPIAITVSYSPMAPNQDYHDIKDILEVPKPERTTWYWYVIGAVLLLLFLLLLFPKKKKEAATETVLKEGAYKQALKNLEALQQKSGLEDKAFFTELVQVFRTYLQQRKGIHSFQQTTGDLSRQLQQLNLPHADLKKLVQTLQLSDVVKFARYTVSENERSEAWMEIRKSIMAIEQTGT